MSYCTLHKCIAVRKEIPSCVSDQHLLVKEFSVARNCVCVPCACRALEDEVRAPVSRVRVGRLSAHAHAPPTPSLPCMPAETAAFTDKDKAVKGARDHPLSRIRAEKEDSEEKNRA